VVRISQDLLLIEDPHPDIASPLVITWSIGRARNKNVLVRSSAKEEQSYGFNYLLTYLA